MSAGIIVLAAIVCTFVAAAVAFGIVLYIREGQQDAEPYEIAARGWWSDNTSITIHPQHKGFRDRLWAALDEIDEANGRPTNPDGTKWTIPEFDHDAVQLAADQGCQIEPRDMVRDGLGGQS